MFGTQLKNAVEEVGIDTRALFMDEEVHTTLAFVHTYPDGDRDFSFYRNPGADMMLTKNEVPEDLIQNSRLFHFGTLSSTHEGVREATRDFSFYRNPGADMMLTKNEVPEDLIQNSRLFHFGTLSSTHEGVREATRHAIEVSKNAGCIITFDPNLRPPLWKSLDDARREIEYGMTKCDVLKISDNEVESKNAGCIITFDPNLRPPLWKSLDDARREIEYGMTKCDVLKISDNEVEFLFDTTDYDKGAALIREKYNIPLVLITMGKAGSRAYYKDMRVEAAPFLQKTTIETTGAGDTFCASTLNYILEHGLENLTEENLMEMLTFANAAASLITTRKGALAGDTFCASTLNYILEHGLENLTEENLMEMLTFANAAASLITTRKGALRVMPSRQEVIDFITESGR